MLAFVITVDQMSAYAVAFFRRAMLLLHVTVLVIIDRLYTQTHLHRVLN
jgi:hypothetical protein